MARIAEVLWCLAADVQCSNAASDRNTLDSYLWFGWDGTIDGKKNDIQLELFVTGTAQWVTVVE